MGKRGNALGQLRKEELDAVLEQSSEAPKGPFEKASADVMKKRRIVRSARKFKSPTPSAGGATPGNSVFASVSLAAPAAAPGGNPFGGFSFGTPAPSASSSTTKPSFSFGSTPTAPTPKSDAAKPAAFPAFAKPAAPAAKPVVPNSGTTTEAEKKLIQCAQGFVKHLQTLQQFDRVGYQRFMTTFSVLEEAAKDAVIKAAPTAPKAKAKATNTWDASRPLFGGAKPLVSPTAGSGSASATTAAANPPSLFGASPAPAPAAATGGFSFNPTKSGAAAAPVPAFSFSTTQSPAVKAAAAAATASATKPESAGGDDDEKKEEDENGELEAADDAYACIYKTKTKIVRGSKYIKGVLKLEKHKESGKHRLVVRDGTTGKVKMNSAISAGMPLSKSVVPATKKKGPTPIVMIKAMFDEESKEPEDFKIITPNEEHEKLYKELQKLV